MSFVVDVVDCCCVVVVVVDVDVFYIKQIKKNKIAKLSNHLLTFTFKLVDDDDVVVKLVEFEFELVVL
jgi:hypothetical protein